VTPWQLNEAKFSGQASDVKIRGKNGEGGRLKKEGELPVASGTKHDSDRIPTIAGSRQRAGGERRIAKSIYRCSPVFICGSSP